MARRLSKELASANERFDAECVDDNLFHWQVALPGPQNTPYAGGTFLVEMIFPSDYPFSTPVVKFQTKIYHPNINHKGETCMAAEWAPTSSAITILDNLSRVLKNPDPDDPLVPEIAAVYKADLYQFRENAEKWTQRYAM